MSFFDIFRKKDVFGYGPNQKYIFDYPEPSKSDDTKGILPFTTKTSDQEITKKGVAPTSSKPEEKPLGKLRFDSPLFSSERKGTKEAWAFPKDNYAYRKPILPQRTVIAIAFENTTKSHPYSNEIYNLISKVIKDNTDALFLLIRMDSKNEYFSLSEYCDLDEKNLKNTLFSLNSCSNNHVKLSDALAYICDYAKLPTSKLDNIIAFKHRKFEVANYKIIFIGTGATDSDAEEARLASEFLQLLRKSSNVKAIKYFCTKDEYTINASLIGFPVIGHIESNFYK